ncbi:MAG: tryptophan synthase subunit beta [Bacteroidetes bacterium]|nr:tryptophan synthase subunit beta [Bacteroidota bacterium]
MKYQVDERGYYGKFGGAFIPEMLYPNVEELRTNYVSIIESEDFKKEFDDLLRNYVGRPTPLFLAERLSEKYKAKIYLKREDLCHTGAHKINNTIGQILLAKRLGKQKIIAETGAGQHGVATATVCALMGMECIVYMGKLDMERQRPNVERMRILGTKVVPAISGNMTLKDATNEAMRHWINHPTDTHYIIGSVVGPHDEHVNLIGVEAAGKGVDTNESAATTALGKIGILHGSKSLLMQTEDGQVIEPYSISAGLDYPGIGPMHAHLFSTGRVQFLNATDDEAMNAGIELSRLEGIIPAIESAHAVAVLKKLELSDEDIVVVNLSGRGDKDLETYIKWGKY